MTMLTMMMRIRKLMLWLAGSTVATVAVSAPAPDQEGTLNTAMNQIVEQYVDQLDSRTLAVSGLRGLARLPAGGTGDEARKAAIDQAIAAEASAHGVAAQSHILANEIMRFPEGAQRDAALAAALREMVAELGPFNRLVTPAELVPPPASVGLELSKQKGALTVVRPLPGSPAERVGIKPGDVVESIDGRPVNGLPLSEAVSLLRGTTGSSVTLALQRAGVAQPVLVHPVRGPVQPPPLLTWKLEGDIAVISMRGFDRGSRENFRTALTAAAQRASAQLAGLVLDLRGNAGGLLDVAEEMGGMLLPAGRRIATLRGRTEANARKLVARHREVNLGLPVVVLVDSQTGAGAEIVAAALQDHGRAFLVGQKTAGAGTIQTVLPLPEGLGAMVVTTARVYRANGARLDAAGVTPDMSLDPQTRQFTVRAEIAADFNTDLQQRIAAEAAAAPAGTDLAQLAALAAIRESGRKTPQGPGTPARRDDIGMKTP